MTSNNKRKSVLTICLQSIRGGYVVFGLSSVLKLASLLMKNKQYTKEKILGIIRAGMLDKQSRSLSLFAALLWLSFQLTREAIYKLHDSLLMTKAEAEAEEVRSQYRQWNTSVEEVHENKIRCKHRDRVDNLITTIAGIASGISLTVLERNRRKEIALYFAMRACQSTLNTFRTNYDPRKKFMYLKHFSSFMFMMSCGQIVYAFISRPETLPPSYVKVR